MDVHSSNWPPEFLCPISLSVMADPVVVSSGQTYERRCIQAWMDLGQTFCVTNRVPLDRNLIISNSVLKAAIRSTAKSKGITTLPSPPSVEQAHVLAKRLIQKQHLLNAGVQEYSDDTISEYRQKNYVQKQPIHTESSRDEEEIKEKTHGKGVKDDDLSGKLERSRIGEESESSQLPGVHTDKSANAHERKGIHLKSSSSLPPFSAATTEHVDKSRGNFVRGSIRARPSADVHQANYARAAVNLEQRFDRFGAKNEFARGGPSGSSSLTDPLIDSQPIGQGPLPEIQHPSRELPPHLVTKPVSYSSSESIPSSLLTPSVIDHLVEMLRSEEEEKQQTAVSQLLQLSRAQENRIPLCRTDVIEALIPHFKSDESDLQANAVASLVNLSIEMENKVRIVRAGVLRFLVEVLHNGSPEAQGHAAGAAFSLAIADENKHPMGVLNVIPPLVQLLHTGPSGARQDAAMALYHLSLLLTNKSKLVKVGAVPILLKISQSGQSPALASRALIILSNIVSIPEGRAALLQLNAIPVLVRLLAIDEDSKGSVSVAEQAAAVLVLLAEKNARFKSLAQSAGLQGLLIRLVDRGSIRARAKACALLSILKESSPVPDEPDESSVLSRQYLRMRVDGEQMNSSAF